MKKRLHTIAHYAFSRAGRNILFWVFMAIIAILDITVLNLEIGIYKKYLLLITNLVVFGPLLYFNNLVLLPKLFDQKKYLFYALTVCCLIPINSYYSYLFINWLIVDIPEIKQWITKVPYASQILANVVFLIAFSMAKYASDWFTNQRKLEKSQKEQSESELKQLKAQVNPHFLFNSLNTIYGIARKKDDETADAILKLSDMMRYVLYDSNIEKIELEKEIQYLKNYINFMQLRLGDRASIEFNCEGDHSDKTIAPMLLITFIENCFKHGVDNQINGWIKIDLHIKEREIHFCCSNSNKNKIIKGKHGIGLKNARRRLELLYPSKHLLNIHKDQQSFTIDLKLSLS